MRYHFVDQIMEIQLGKSIIAKKNITASEDCFTDHFPGFPVYPGALLLETMAQVGGVLIEKTLIEQGGKRVLPALSIVRHAKFRRPVLPGDTLLVEVKLENLTETAAGASAEIRCETRLVADAHILYTLLDVKDDLGLDSFPEIDKVIDTLCRISDVKKRLEGLE